MKHSVVTLCFHCSFINLNTDIYRAAKKSDFFKNNHKINITKFVYKNIYLGRWLFSGL
jgi:hypothetical protein